MLQRYEKKGLISPSARNKYGYLLYDEQTVNKILLIRFLQKLDYDLNEIHDLMLLSTLELKHELINRAQILESTVQELQTRKQVLEKIICTSLDTDCFELISELLSLQNPEGEIQ